MFFKKTVKWKIRREKVCQTRYRKSLSNKIEKKRNTIIVLIKINNVLLKAKLKQKYTSILVEDYLTAVLNSVHSLWYKLDTY